MEGSDLPAGVPPGTGRAESRRRKLMLSLVALLLISLAGGGSTWLVAVRDTGAGDGSAQSQRESVRLWDNDGDGSHGFMFDVRGMVPGQSATRCIEITYDGAGPGDVRLFAQHDAGAGSRLFDVVVRRGRPTGAPFPHCGGFVDDGTLSHSPLTLATFPATFADGLAAGGPAGAGSWRPGERHLYRFTVLLVGRPSSARGGSAGPVTFVWQARSAAMASDEESNGR